MRYFVRNIFKDDDSRGYTLEQIQSAVEADCDLDRLSQLKITKSNQSKLPFPINNYVLMDNCSDLIFPYYISQPTPSNPVANIIYKNRMKKNIASNVRDIMEQYQEQNQTKFISFTTLAKLLTEHIQHIMLI